MGEKPFEYWTFNGYQNGLYGAESKHVFLPDGRRIIQKDPDHPAVLEDDYILNALSRSPAARASFKKIFPTLDPVSQDRLTTLIRRHPNRAKLIKDGQDWADQIQRKEVRSGVRVRLPKPFKG